MEDVIAVWLIFDNAFRATIFYDRNEAILLRGEIVADDSSGISVGTNDVWIVRLNDHDDLITIRINRSHSCASASTTD